MKSFKCRLLEIQNDVNKCAIKAQTNTEKGANNHIILWEQYINERLAQSYHAYEKELSQ